MKKGDSMPQFMTRDDWLKWAHDHPDPPAERREIPALRKFGSVEAIEKAREDPTTGMVDVDFVISTPSVDRENDTIDVNGWDLEAYLKNPVVLWAHDYSRPPVARAEKVWKKGKKLMARDRFTPQEINPFGHMVYQMVRGGFLRATSVGFRPLTYVRNDDRKGYDFFTQELMEHSIVPVPANAEALQAASAEGIDLDPLREWAEKILDRDPEGDKVALWLPKDVIETVHASLSNVAVSYQQTSTSSSTPDVKITTTDGTSAGDLITEPTAEETEALEISRWLRDLPLLSFNYDDERKDAVMDELKEAIQALSEVVREVNENLKALPDEIAEKVDQKMVERFPEKDGSEEGDDFTEDDLKAIVTAAVQAALISATGKLPE